jgi:uncharacterized protein (DUF1778 family)
MLQQAASVTHKTLTEFLIDSGLAAAFDALADRRVFQLDDDGWQKFNDALDTPPQDNLALQRLLARKPAWEV